ncbi:MAG: YidC/Oxa1 family insertase periplasmic-domain containing protein, partial [Gemmatimonadaceae bacterium]
LAYGYKPKGGNVESIPFAKLDSGVIKQVGGGNEWVAVRDKYFLVAVISPDSSLGAVTFTGAPRVAKLAPEAMATVTLPLKDGKASFDLYVGPQEFERLRALGHDLDRVNPYAGWLHGVVQPFATLVTKVLLWMKSASGLGYGWVIIIFGVSIRLLLWPLNQSAMRTSIRMQRLQPELAEVQKRYKNDPDKQRDALVKLYQAHGMTPFSPMMGCLPMLLPMPILFALYFVFLNTIEFRGVSFLWLHDISAADPYYILPLLMGLSMFALSWIGMRGMPPNPQTKMMSYMMPVVLTFMFFRFAAGLNLYYAVQNVAALPQQWLLARERAGMAKGDGATKDRRDKT